MAWPWSVRADEDQCTTRKKREFEFTSVKRPVSEQCWRVDKELQLTSTDSESKSEG